jgi:hypothetical protein
VVVENKVNGCSTLSLAQDQRKKAHFFLLTGAWGSGAGSHAGVFIIKTSSGRSPLNGIPGTGRSCGASRWNTCIGADGNEAFLAPCAPHARLNARSTFWSVENKMNGRSRLWAAQDKEKGADPHAHRSLGLCRGARRSEDVFNVQRNLWCCTAEWNPRNGTKL